MMLVLCGGEVRWGGGVDCKVCLTGVLSVSFYNG